MRDGAPREGSVAPLARGAIGLLGSVPMPILGAAFPLSSSVAFLALLMRPIRPAPRYLVLLAASSLISVALMMLSTYFHHIHRPTEIVYTASFTLFLVATWKITDGVRTTQSMLALLSIATLGYLLIVGTTLTRQGADYFWKYGASFPVIIVCLWVAQRHRWRATAVPALLLAAAAISLFSSFRSEAGVCIFVLIVYLVKDRQGRIGVIRGAIAAALLYGSMQLVIAQIEAGRFGVDLQRKAIYQDNGGIFGRVEPPLSIAAIVERPWFGWGGEYEIDRNAVARGVEYANKVGMTDRAQYFDVWFRGGGGTVSLHSMFFSSWVDAGIFAAAFLAILILVFARAIVTVGGQAMPLIVFVSVQSIFDILFSPWSENRGVTLAVSAVLVLWSINDSDSGQGLLRVQRSPELAGRGTRNRARGINARVT